MPNLRCPCLSGVPYDSCCGRLHSGVATAQTAEQLMRSRYSAFAMNLPDYLLTTWHPRTRPESLDLDDAMHWYRLDIISAEAGGPFDAAGIVEFEAFYRSPSGNGSQREVSRFVREAGKWLYLDGTAG